MDKKFFFNNLGESFNRLKSRLEESEKMIDEGKAEARKTGDLMSNTLAYAGAFGKISAAIECHLMTFEAMKEAWLPDSVDDLKDINI